MVIEESETIIETAPAGGTSAEFFLRGIAALIEALLFMGLSIPAAFLAPLFISRMDAITLVPQIPGAFFLEGLLPGLCLPVFAICAWGYFDNNSSLTIATPAIWCVTLGVLLLFNLLYHAIMESSPVGGTLGKLIVGLRVVSAKGGRATFIACLSRNIFRIFSTFPFLQGYWLISKPPANQSLHDLLSSCRVVKASTLDDRIKSVSKSRILSSGNLDEIDSRGR